MLALIQQPDKPAKQPTPSQAAGIVSFWAIFASLSLIVLLIFFVVVFSRRKMRLRRLRMGKGPKTRYVDAWSEAGNRMKTPDDLDDLIDTPPPDSDGDFGPDKKTRHPRGRGKP